MRWKAVSLRILGIIVGGLFIYAGALKVADPVQFARDIDNYHLLPWPIAVGLAFYLPWLEIGCGVALLLRRAYLGGLAILTILLSIFIAASIMAKARGIDISCGCFGHLSRNFSFTWHLVLDFAILAVLVLLWYLTKLPQKSETAVAQPAGDAIPQ
jgi:putative oxidoreductase